MREIHLRKKRTKEITICKKELHIIKQYTYDRTERCKHMRGFHIREKTQRKK